MSTKKITVSESVYLILTPFFPSQHDFRGVFIYDLLVALRNQLNCQFEIIIIGPKKKDLNDYMYDGFHCTHFSTIELPSYFLPGLFTTINLAKLLKIVKMVLNNRTVKVIHSHSIYPCGLLGYHLSRKYNVKCIMHHHGLDIAGETFGRLLKGPLRSINNFYLKKKFTPYLKHTELNVGVSKKVTGQLEAIVPECKENSYVMYNGVNSSIFHNLGIKKTTDPFTIGCVGNFFKIKDQITILKAIYNLEESGIKNIKATFIGTGTTLDECKSYVSSKKLQNIDFINSVAHTGLNQFYNSINLFVLPSFFEALGCVYMEALQVGIPIVAIKGMGIEEILHPKDKPYSLINKGDYLGLATIIKYRMSNCSIEKYNLDINLYVSDFLNYCQRKNLFRS